MSDRIHELIENVRGKVTSLHSQLLTERTNNQKLQEEVTSLQNEITSKDEEVAALKAKVVELESNKNTTEVQNVSGSVDAGVSNEQIDELVKEIEYCIEQLKK